MSDQRGYVLALTLWALAAMAIVIGSFAERVWAALELAKSSQQRAQSLIESSETRADLLFRLATTPMSLYGLGRGSKQAIALDDRPYRGEGDNIIRLQDCRGLLDPNLAGGERIGPLLGVLGVPFEARASLLDTLEDYRDPDDFKRLSGAEKNEYHEAGLPPPLNNELITPNQIYGVLGWRDNPYVLENNRFADLITVGTSVGVNLNTAPWEVLMTLPGVSRDQAQALIDIRQQRPVELYDPSGLLAGIPAAVYMTQVYVLPSESVRVTQYQQGSGSALRYNVTLTPHGERSPWRIDYLYKIEFPYAHDASDKVFDLPKWAAPSENSGPPVLPF